MNLEELAIALNRPGECWSMLIYGAPSSGKTELAATIARLDSIDHVLYVGLENGHKTLEKMLRTGKLTPEQARKIIMLIVDDSPDLPLAFETCGKIICTQKAHSFCIEHGKADCAICKKEGKAFQDIDITKWRERGVVIIDSGSQLSDSIMHYYTKGKGVDFKAGWDEYGPLGLRLTEMLTIIQRAKTNWIMITHEIAIDIKSGTTAEIAKQEDKETYERIFPMIGTKPFCMKVAKYFGHRIYTHIKLRQHKAGSSTTYMANVITGSREDWHIENLKSPDLAELITNAKAKETQDIKENNVTRLTPAPKK